MIISNGIFGSDFKIEEIHFYVYLKLLYTGIIIETSGLSKRGISRMIFLLINKMKKQNIINFWHFFIEIIINILIK